MTQEIPVSLDSSMVALKVGYSTGDYLQGSNQGTDESWIKPQYPMDQDVEGFWNGGTPKSSMFIGQSIINYKPSILGIQH